MKQFSCLLAAGEFCRTTGESLTDTNENQISRLHAESNRVACLTKASGVDFWKPGASSVNRKRKKTTHSPFAFFFLFFFFGEGDSLRLKENRGFRVSVSNPRPNSDSEEEEVGFIEEISTVPVGRGVKVVFSV